MLFPTIDFAIFFVVVFGLNWLLRPYGRLWRLFLVVASYFFYGAWDARFLLLLAGMTVGNYLAGLAIFAAVRARERPDEGPPQLPRRAFYEAAIGVVPGSLPGFARDVLAHPRVLLGLGVGGNLALLGWFKYYGFFATSFVNVLGDIGVDASLPLVQVVLPIGISFLTFQAVSYLVDIYRGTSRPLGAVDFAVYLSFFPHVVAGPIVRASEFAPQLAKPLDSSKIEAPAAFMLIAGGLFKKVVIASYLSSQIVDPVFGVPGNHGSVEILVAIYAYAIQIFADFSGYTDIAIGCALLLGFRLPQNFASPYAAVSLQDFWRRWHMSLSRWLRDYVYIPLGGSRKGSLLTARNLMLTFVLGGLWHGAAWTFVVWGAIHGLWLVIERGLGLERRARTRAWQVVRWAVTFNIVCLSWVFFRAESLGDALELLRRLFTAGGGAPLVTPLLVAVIAGAVVWQFAPLRWFAWLQENFVRIGPLPQAATLAVALVVIDGLGPKGVAPFIYFQF